MEIHWSKVYKKPQINAYRQIIYKIVLKVNAYVTIGGFVLFFFITITYTA